MQLSQRDGEEPSQDICNSADDFFRLLRSRNTSRAVLIPWFTRHLSDAEIMDTNISFLLLEAPKQTASGDGMYVLS